MESPFKLPDADALLALMPHAVCVLDERGRILWRNPSSAGMLEDAARDGEGALFAVAACGESAGLLAEAAERCLAGSAVDPVVVRCACKDGPSLWVEWRFAPYGEGRVVVWGRDASSERRRSDTAAELRLLEGEAERCAGLGSWRFDLSDRSSTWSPEMYRIFGVDPSDSRDLTELAAAAVHPEDRPVFDQGMQEALAGGVPALLRYRIVLPDGTVKWVNAEGRHVHDDPGRVVALVGFVQDVTQQVEAEDALRVSEARYRSIIDGMQDAYFRADLEGRLILTNQAAAAMYGFDSAAQMVGIEAASLYAEEGERDDVIAQLRRDGFVADRIGRGRRRDGSTFWVSLNVGLAWDENGAAIGTEGFSRDVTARILAQDALGESLSLLTATLESTADGILVVARDGKVASYNRRFAELWGITKRLLDAGDDAGLLDFASSRLADSAAFLAQVADLYEHPEAESFDVLEFADGTLFERYSRPQMIDDRIAGRVWSFRDVTQKARTERALREREEDLCDAQAIARIGSYAYDIAADVWTSSETMDDIFGIDSAYVRDLAGWLALVHEFDREMMRTYFAEEVVGKRLPFDKQYRVMRAADGHSIWVHGHGRLEFGGDGAPVKMIGTIQDVDLRHRDEEELQHTNRSLERMVYEVAEAMGRVVEIRDQYTKGHQERTARLAKAIATEMGLEQHDILAVEMAAVVHDIGKLSVPAEILSRPTTLSKLEMSLIKEHPINGYEVLRDIPFPWPVAEIVLQHHERLDGSGYPAGLRGDRIVPLARILMVADVVEAMATHRPYRPALGTDAAIAELRQWPEKYDGAVVEACVRLHERGEIDL